MKKSALFKVALLICATSFFTVGCVVSPYPGEPVATVGAEVDVDAGPPAPMVEVVPPAPAIGFVWIGGAWAWNGGRWAWEGGHWARPPHPGAVWVPHQYVYRNGRHVFVRGGWR
jgi:hypothetical protein